MGGRASVLIQVSEPITVTGMYVPDEKVRCEINISMNIVLYISIHIVYLCYSKFSFKFIFVLCLEYFKKVIKDKQYKINFSFFNKKIYQIPIANLIHQTTSIIIE